MFTLVLLGIMSVVLLLYWCLKRVAASSLASNADDEEAAIVEAHSAPTALFSRPRMASSLRYALENYFGLGRTEGHQLFGH